MSKTSREIVLDILLDIDRNDRFAGDALGGALRANQFMNKKERAYISRLTEGVTEQKIRLDYILNQFSKTMACSGVYAGTKRQLLILPWRMV